MADAKIEQQKVREITEKLEQGLQDLFESEKYKNYLTTMSKFHNYSFNNTMLIAMQNPDATLVAGYNAWKNKFKRQVKKGEKGIKILAPAPYKIKREEEKTDPVTGEIIIDEFGKPVMEEVEVTIPNFRVVSVFDVEQTYGKELPELEVKELSDSVEDYENFMQALTEISPVPIEFENVEGGAKGYFSQSTHRIAIQKDMSQSQTLKTAIHEMAHAKLHDRELNKDMDEEEHKDRNTKEVEAESVAYTVCQHFGIETSDYSFGYIAGWSRGKEMAELKSSLDTIRKTASEIITGIEQELKKERKRTVEQEQPAEIGEKDASELYIMHQAEKLIEQIETEKTIFSRDERDLIVNYAYKMGDMDKTTKLAYQLADLEENSPNLVAQTIINAQAEIDSLPDSMVGISEMHEYGYTWAEMLPLTQERALELFDHDLTIYKLFKDGSETMIEDRVEVMKHEGMFGVEKDDWEKYVEYQNRSEVQLLHGAKNYFGLYQLNDSPQAKKIRFMDSDYLEKKGVAISRENYNLVYTAPLEDGMTLEKIYTRFNINHPKDFRGHSLSVSDIVVLHKNGENSCHYVDSFGYKDVPEFVHEAIEKLQKKQTSAIGEVKKIPDDISQNNIEEETEPENAVFLVNYNEWKTMEELDLSQNYFAIDDPYNDGDFILLWLQNTIKDITPAGVQYYDYEEAVQALSLMEREIANLPHNKENNIGSYMVNGKAQLERIMEARNRQKYLDMENDISYYVIEDISTWAENKPDRSKLERFNNLAEALEKFNTYSEKYREVDDKTRTTLGFNVQGSEFDVLYARNNENILSLDYTHSSKALQNNRFIDDLQILCNELVDKVRVSRDMTPEEEKAFVKERFKHKLENSGLDDIDMYMSRFNLLYEQGKMEYLMPSANQKRIVEDIPLEKWDTSYFALHEVEQMAFAFQDKYVSIQICDEGYDYSIYHADYSLFDGGIYDNPDITIHAALYDILEDMGVKRRELVSVDYDELMEKTEAVERSKIEKNRIISAFRKRTKEMFHDINGQTPEDVEQRVLAYIQSKIDEYDMDIELVDVILSGSRCRGIESEKSDIDIVVEYKGRNREDDLFNTFHEDGFLIAGIKVDIIPIKEEKTGTLTEYLPRVEKYLDEKKASMEQKIAVEQIQEDKKISVKEKLVEKKAIIDKKDMISTKKDIEKPRER